MNGSSVAYDILRSGMKFLIAIAKQQSVLLHQTSTRDWDRTNKAFLDAKSRGVRLRYLTAITKSDLSYCKELEIVHELHQLGGIKGNFMISEREYLALLILFEEGKIAPQIIYSNVKDIVEQQQYVFDTFWSNGRPAEQRIKEIEEGIVTRYETRVLENPQQINNHLKYVIENAAERSVCCSIGGMQLIYNNFFDLY